MSFFRKKKQSPFLSLLFQGIRDLFLTFSLNNQPLILWKAKPSVARILTGLMPLSPNISIPYFLLCSSEQELESLIDGDNCSDSMNGNAAFTTNANDISIGCDNDYYYAPHNFLP